MAGNSVQANCERISTLEPSNPTLIEGFPGRGLVAAIAVEQITDQLELEHHSNINDESFPPVVTFEDGLVQNLVRVYASEEPSVMTLQSDLSLPPNAFEPLSSCVLSDLAEQFGRAIFIAGAPAENEEQLGEVEGVATSQAVHADLVDAGIPIAEDHGIVGGITGALTRECYRGDIPAALLIVRAHPQLPDPGAAKSLIENALEPLVDFDIETTELEERAEEIRSQLQEIAQQYDRANESRSDQRSGPSGMYQ